jgi:16S rRNA (cytosine1402-N4)-methyltransferase
MRNLDCDEPLGIPLKTPHPSYDPDYHSPVMPEQVLGSLRARHGMLVLDATAGGGGHSEMLLRAGAEVVALDRDPAALAQCAARLAEFSDRIRLVESDFRDVGKVFEKTSGGRLFHGALLDIGVSSRHLDDPERGFSMLREGPLDMRMSPGSRPDAAEVVNTLPATELARIFREYGEEPMARRIAAGIVEARTGSPFETTTQLASFIESLVPRRGPRHPATRVFQALRIHVNDELGALREVLRELPPLLAKGARLAIITFHSLEDRIVKVFFREHSREWIDRPEWPAPKRNPNRLFHLVTRHPITASMEEVASNPRARSAKLRVVEKI